MPALPFYPCCSTPLHFARKSVPVHRILDKLEVAMLKLVASLPRCDAAGMHPDGQWKGRQRRPVPSLILTLKSLSTTTRRGRGRGEAWLWVV
jgi:hypothetical protein